MLFWQRSVSGVLVWQHLLRFSVCFVAMCCSHNIIRYDEKTNNIWRQYLKDKDNWCPYNPDGSKKKLPDINQKKNYTGILFK